MTEKIESPSVELTESKIIIFRGPFPWPILLGLVLPVAVVAFLVWMWHHNNYIQFFRTAWILLCSVVPGLYLMVIMGSIAQFKKRSVISIVSFLLGLAVLIACAWSIHKIAIISADSF